MNENIQSDKTNIDNLIDLLPDQFPAAQEMIKFEIAPHVVDCSAGIRDHYIKVIKKRTNAASIKSVSLLIDEAVNEINDSVFNNDEKSFEETRTIDPEIQQMSEQIASDPHLFKNRIEMVNKLGVIGEKRNIGIYQTVIDSSLLPMGTSGSEALAAKNSGPQGSGKSHPLFTTLKLYPKSAYYLITSGSAKSLYNLNDGLKHKALILTEALQLQSGRQGDNELAYSIRTLVSEGHLKYQYTGFIDKKKVTIVQELEGPTSLLTTTIHGKLEEQLEDRMITIHPNTTAEQTRDIISRTAEMASGNGDPVDQKTLDAWKLFYESLEPMSVVIPYAKDIAEFINRRGSLPIASRRAFKRVLATIKTIALIHQKQRCRDDMGNVIAEYSDYALSYQLVGDAFRESLGEGQRYTDHRIRLIEEFGVITPRALSKKDGVTTASISQWLKPLIEKGVLSWCDEKGNGFIDVADLEKAKRSGKAHLTVSGGKRLPTLFELTGDPGWDRGGDLYAAYDLHLDGVEGDQVYHQDEEMVSGQDVIIDFENATSKDKPAVKVLSEKSHAEVLKMVDDFKKNQPAIDPNNVVSINLSNEFEEILSQGPIGLVN